MSVTHIRLTDAHRWPVVSPNGSVIGSVELHGGRFVPVDLSGEVVGNYATLFDARAALLQARR